MIKARFIHCAFHVLNPTANLGWHNYNKIDVDSYVVPNVLNQILWTWVSGKTSQWNYSEIETNKTNIPDLSPRDFNKYINNTTIHFCSPYLCSSLVFPFNFLVKADLTVAYGLFITQPGESSSFSKIVHSQQKGIVQDKREYFVLLKHNKTSTILDLSRPYRAHSLPNTAAFFVRACLILCMHLVRHNRSSTFKSMSSFCLAVPCWT